MPLLMWTPPLSCWSSFGKFSILAHVRRLLAVERDVRSRGILHVAQRVVGDNSGW
jgi:hypothetical protein